MCGRGSIMAGEGIGLCKANHGQRGAEAAHKVHLGVLSVSLVAVMEGMGMGGEDSIKSDGREIRRGRGGFLIWSRWWMVESLDMFPVHGLDTKCH